MPIGAIASGLTATKATLDVAKILMDNLNRPNVDVHDVRIKVQEMLIHMVNAQIALGEVQSNLYDAKEDNRQLKREIEKLKDREAETKSLVIADEVYLKRKSDGTFDGPFCPPCWDIDGNLLKVISPNGRYITFTYDSANRSINDAASRTVR